ncbi:MAG: DUF4367 domain-containing protein [Lachnospiraceae bacterium]|nr:DUF4367 domain-containing protein [Lachnospiraceae bacterium]
MKQMEVTDELLYQYMPIADEMDLDALEAEIADEEIVLSKKFERRMKRLMWKEEHKWVAGFGKFMAKVAVVLLCVLGVSLAVTMSVDAYRSKFFQTVQEIWEDSVVHTYDIGEEGQEFVPHEPSYIPEGYEEVRRIETDRTLNIEYQKDYTYLYWDQYEITDGTWNILDNYKEQVIAEIDGGYIIINLYDKDIVRAYYEKEQYIYVVSAENVSVEEVIFIFESIN